MPASMRIAAPPRATFDYLADPRNRPEWQASLRAVEMLDDGPIGVGTRWIDHTVAGIRPHLEITEMRPPGEDRAGVWREVGRWHGFTADLVLHVATGTTATTATTGSTVLTWWFELDSTRAWAPVRLVLAAVAPAAVDADLRRAAAVLEARSA